MRSASRSRRSEGVPACSRWQASRSKVAGVRHGDRAVGRALLDVADMAAHCAAVDGDAAGAGRQMGLGVRPARDVHVHEIEVGARLAAEHFRVVRLDRDDLSVRDRNDRVGRVVATGAVTSGRNPRPPDRMYEQEDMSATSQGPPMTEDSSSCILAGERSGIAIDSVIVPVCCRVRNAPAERFASAVQTAPAAERGRREGLLSFHLLHWPRSPWSRQR